MGGRLSRRRRSGTRCKYAHRLTRLPICALPSLKKGECLHALSLPRSFLCALIRPPPPSPPFTQNAAPHPRRPQPRRPQCPVCRPRRARHQGRRAQREAPLPGAPGHTSVQKSHQQQHWQPSAKGARPASHYLYASGMSHVHSPAGEQGPVHRPRSTCASVRTEYVLSPHPGLHPRLLPSLQCGAACASTPTTLLGLPHLVETPLLSLSNHISRHMLSARTMSNR